MKKFVWIMVISILLSGCGTTKVVTPEEKNEPTPSDGKIEQEVKTDTSNTNIGDEEDELEKEDKGDKGDEGVDWTYADEENQLLLSYPNVFSADGVMDENGTVRFESQQDGSALLYWLVPNTYGDSPNEFIQSFSVDEIEEMEGNVVIAKTEDLDQETGQVMFCANYWVVDIDWIANVAIICDSPQEASQWYDLLKEGAVYIENVSWNDSDPGAWENPDGQVWKDVTGNFTRQDSDQYNNGVLYMEYLSDKSVMFEFRLMEGSESEDSANELMFSDVMVLEYGGMGRYETDLFSEDPLSIDFSISEDGQEVEVTHTGGMAISPDGLYVFTD